MGFLSAVGKRTLCHSGCPSAYNDLTENELSKNARQEDCDVPFLDVLYHIAAKDSTGPETTTSEDQRTLLLTLDDTQRGDALSVKETNRIVDD